MLKNIIYFVSFIFFMSCGGDQSETKIPKDWQMREVYGDAVDVLNEGGYYGLFYDRDNPLKDSFLEQSDDRIVALAVSDQVIVGKSDAYIWVADSNFKLILTDDKTEKKNKYFRKYEDDNFEVTLDMKFWERIDGMDEEDMYIFRGKMKVTSKEYKNSKEYKVKGGI